MCAVLIPLALEVDALLILGVVTAVWVALIAYETLRYAEERSAVRAERVGH